MSEEDIDKKIIELLFMTMGAGKRAVEFNTKGGFEKISQYRCLEIIVMHGGVIDQRELLKRMEIRPGSLSELLLKLQQNGFIQRAKNSEDRRSNVVKITQKGEQENLRAKEHRNKIFSRRMSVLSDSEKQQLYALLLKLHTAWSCRECKPEYDLCKKGAD